MVTVAERRRTPRASLREDGRLETSDGIQGCRTLDVGLGGMAVLTRAPAPGGYVRINFRVGLDSSLFQVDGVVVRQYEREGASVWGIQFRHMDPGTRTRLRDYVAARACDAQHP